MLRLLTLLFLALATPLHAQCRGQNLIEALPPAERAALRAAVAQTPFATGNLWQATRGGETVTLVGTFHLDDPRHDAVVARLTPALTAAGTLLVEAGPEEEAALKDLMARDPSRMLITEGPTLPEALSPADWQRLSDALRARGIPPFMAAKMKPWFLTAMLAIPPCSLASAAADNGLDRRLIDLAAALKVPVHGLEPFDTLFTIFDSFTPAEQMALLTQTLDTEAGSDDMAQTLSDTYFSGEARLFWEYTRAQTLALPGMTRDKVDRDFAMVEDALMIRRNHNWVPVIEAAAQDGPIVAAFGALHLSGDQGVLNLLRRNGWTIAPLAP